MPPRKKSGKPDSNPMPDANNPMLGDALLEQNDPFEEADDPDAQMLADDLNDPDRVDLEPYDEGPITGYQAVPQPPIDDLDSSPVVGRPTSPQLWAAASLHPNVTQLRVWKIENGIPISIGAIDSRASEDDFIRYFFANMPKPGEGRVQFKIRPLDNQGREIMQERTLPPIDENHATLRRLRAQEAAVAAGTSPPAWFQPAPAAPALSEVLELARALTAPTLAQAEAAARENAELRKLMQERMERTSEREIELASRTGSTVEAMTDRILQNDAKRNESLLSGQQNLANQAISQQQAMFQSLMMMQQQAAERDRQHALDLARQEADRRDRDRAEAEERRQRERQEYEARLREREMEMQERRERERLALERERDDQRRRDEERDRERQRSHDQRMKEMELQAQRDREHAERMAQLAMASTKQESAEGFLERGAKMLALVGMKPGDVIEKLSGGSADLYAPAIEGGLKLLETGITALADYAKAHKTAETSKEIAATQAAAALQAGYSPAGALALQGPTSQAMPAGDAAVEAPAAAPPAVQTVEVVDSKLSLAAQKEARQGIRDLIGELRKTPDQSQWEGIVMRHIGVNMAILHYAREQTLRRVLKEAGVDDTTLSSLIDFVAKLNHPMLSEIPIG